MHVQHLFCFFLVDACCIRLQIHLYGCLFHMLFNKKHSLRI
jgi:hypothetical protein